MDLESSEELAQQLGVLFPENQLYRIDHYLGKELAQVRPVLANSSRQCPWVSQFLLSGYSLCTMQPVSVLAHLNEFQYIIKAGCMLLIQ